MRGGRQEGCVSARRPRRFMAKTACNLYQNPTADQSIPQSHQLVACVQNRSGSSPSSWPAACSMSGEGAVSVKTLPISSPSCTMITRPDRRRSVVDSSQSRSHRGL